MRNFAPKRAPLPFIFMILKAKEKRRERGGGGRKRERGQEVSLPRLGERVDNEDD